MEVFLLLFCAFSLFSSQSTNRVREKCVSLVKTKFFSHVFFRFICLILMTTCCFPVDDDDGSDANFFSLEMCMFVEHWIGISACVITLISHFSCALWLEAKHGYFATFRNDDDRLLWRMIFLFKLNHLCTISDLEMLQDTEMILRFFFCLWHEKYCYYYDSSSLVLSLFFSFFCVV